MAQAKHWQPGSWKPRKRILAGMHGRGNGGSAPISPRTRTWNSTGSSPPAFWMAAGSWACSSSMATAMPMACCAAGPSLIARRHPKPSRRYDEGASSPRCTTSVLRDPRSTGLGNEPRRQPSDRRIAQRSDDQWRPPPARRERQEAIARPVSEVRKDQRDQPDHHRAAATQVPWGHVHAADRVPVPGAAPSSFGRCADRRGDEADESDRDEADPLPHRSLPVLDRNYEGKGALQRVEQRERA